MIGADGSGRIALTANERINADPVWSPDGNRLAFSSSRDDPDTDGDGFFARAIFVMDADGGRQVRLTPARSDLNQHSPRWAPDGRRLVYETGDLQVAIVGADGNGGRSLTASPDFGLSPSWGPDSRRVAVTVSRGARTDVLILDADGVAPPANVTGTAPQSIRIRASAWGPR